MMVKPRTPPPMAPDNLRAPYLRACHNFMFDRVEIYQRDPKDEQSRAGQQTDPAFTLRYDHAQILMDDLWAMGLRPRGEATEGMLAALTAHRDSLQALVDKILPHALREQDD